jgi:hypothetical protein
MRRMSFWRRALLAWLPIAVAVTCLGLLGYAAVEQVYRTGADDPQVQLARDAAAAIAGGESADQVVASLRGAGISGTDVVLDGSPEVPGGSLAPFVIVYDTAGEPVASSARLGGEVPRIPNGVLATARLTGENRVTWQPTSSLRIAAVAVPDRQGDRAHRIVVAGRSLREVEGRIETLTQMALIGWVFTLVATFVAVVVAEKLGGRA